MPIKGAGFGNPTGSDFKVERGDWISFWVYIYNANQNGTIYSIMKSDGGT